MGVVVRPGNPSSLDAVRSEMLNAFERLRGAVHVGSPVVVVLAAEDLLGHGTCEGAAFANGLIGLTRAAAFEGAKPGWKVNVLAVPAGREVSDDEALKATSTEGLSGQVVTLGTSLVGKLLP